MADIQKVKIGQLFKYTIPGEWGNDADFGCGIPVVRSTNFRNDGKLDLTDVVVRDVPKGRLKRREIVAGDILIEKSGGSPTQPAGRVVYCPIDFNGTSSNFIEICKVREEFDSHYVFYLLYSLYHQGRIMKYQQQTTGIINFKLNDYKEEEVFILANKAEQQQVAGKIALLENSIAHTEALITKHERLRAGLLHDLLTNGIDEHGQLRSEQTHAFQDSAIGRIPVEWEVEECGQLGKWHGGLTPSKARPDFWYNGQHMWVSPKDIRKGFIEDSEDKLTDAALERMRIFPAEDNVIAVFRSGVLRHSFPVCYSTKIFTVNQDLKVLVPKAGIEARFILYVLQKLETLIVNKIVKHGTTVESVDTKAFHALPIPIPSHTEQLRIIGIVKGMDAQIDNFRFHSSKLQRLKTGLMQDLLTPAATETAVAEAAQLVEFLSA